MAILLKVLYENLILLIRNTRICETLTLETRAKKSTAWTFDPNSDSDWDSNCLEISSIPTITPQLW